MEPTPPLARSSTPLVILGTLAYLAVVGFGVLTLLRLLRPLLSLPHWGVFAV